MIAGKQESLRLSRLLAAITLLGIVTACGADRVPDPVDTMEMVTVPAGPFLMGCDVAADEDCRDDEGPTREVALEEFEIMRTEVQQIDYWSCMIDGACSEPKCDWNPVERPNYPVSCIAWAQAEQFCQWAGLALPTEAQWEKAARGTDGRMYPWGNDEPTCELANFVGCAGIRSPVGTHPLGDSPYGAADMAGNVPEWVADWYDADYYNVAPETDPSGPDDGIYRIFRGGSFQNNAPFLRGADRAKDFPSDFITQHLAYLGVRCVK